MIIKYMKCDKAASFSIKSPKLLRTIMILQLLRYKFFHVITVYNINTALHIGFGGIIVPLPFNKYTSTSLLERKYLLD